MFESILLRFEIFCFDSLKWARNKGSLTSDRVFSRRKNVYEIPIIEKYYFICISSKCRDIRSKKAFFGFGISSKH
jgi:hypothetical protein